MLMNLDWIKNEIIKSKGDYKTITCLFYKENKCSIYKIRPSCCRNYPQKNWYCSSEECFLLLRGLDWKNEQSNNDCLSCKKKCCERILVPNDVKITKAFLLKWLDIWCEDCKKLF